MDMSREKVRIMRDLMYKFDNYNWTFCYSRCMSDTMDTFEFDLPVAYKKIMSG